jgi:hypothetical protein
MKNIILSFLSIVITLVVYSQGSVNADSCIVIKPDWESGADAVLHGLSSEFNTNYGTQSQFCANAWTFGGTSGTVRSVIDFHIQNWVPVGAQITSATLKLYGLTVSGYGFGQHSSLSGSNACWLERVTTQWNENTVTWNTQPQTTIQNRVSMSQSTTGNQNYSVNVTQLVIDMLQNSLSSYGFMIKLKNEQHYRRMNFYSSDYVIDSLRPELKICYIRSSTGISEEMNKITVNVYPNPAQDILNISISRLEQDAQLKIFDITGRLLMEKTLMSNKMQIDVSGFSKGVYIVEVQSKKLGIARQKVVINR